MNGYYMNFLKILLCIGMLFPSKAFASFNLSSAFNQVQQVGPYVLSLRGAGLKQFFTLKIVAIGLYMPEGVDDVLGNCPKRLEVLYLQDIPKTELDKATIKGIRLNTSPAQYKNLEEKIKAINRKYQDIRKGDKITINYIPGQGLQMMINHNDKGTIAGDDIAQAFFSIWLGKHPVDENMKQRLLGYRQETHG